MRDTYITTYTPLFQDITSFPFLDPSQDPTGSRAAFRLPKNRNIFPTRRSEVARRLQLDRLAVIRAVRRVENDPYWPETARLIRGALGLPEPEIRQH
jgi:hypothetical protein